jgi:hypothetical protein
MQSLKLVDGDILFENDELAMIEDKEELVQCCQTAIKTNLNEWFLNPQMGIDQKALTGKGLSDEAIIGHIRSVLAQEPRIKTVDEIKIDKDLKARTMTITFYATGQQGEEVIGGSVLNA